MRTAYGGSAVVGVELGEDAPGVGPQGIDRDVQMTGDLGAGEVAVEEVENLELPIAQRVDQGRWRGCSGRLTLSGTSQPIGDGYVPLGDSLLEQVDHRDALVQVQPGVAVRFGGVEKCPFQSRHCVGQVPRA